jgi:hypothetical protein
MLYQFLSFSLHAYIYLSTKVSCFGNPVFYTRLEGRVSRLRYSIIFLGKFRLHFCIAILLTIHKVIQFRCCQTVIDKFWFVSLKGKKGKHGDI